MELSLCTPNPIISSMESKATPTLVIEPHPLMRTSLFSIIGADPDFELIQPGIAREDAITLKLPNQEDVLFLCKQPAIVIMAIGNPGWDDIHAISEIQECIPNAAVLALISNEVPGQEVEALACGARAVLPKTASRSELMQALHWLRREDEQYIRS